MVLRDIRDRRRVGFRASRLSFDPKPEAGLKEVVVPIPEYLSMPLPAARLDRVEIELAVRVGLEVDIGIGRRREDRYRAGGTMLVRDRPVTATIRLRVVSSRPFRPVN